MPQVAAGAVLAGLASGLSVSAAGAITFSLTTGGFLLAAGSSLVMGGAQMLLSSGSKKSKAALNSTRASSTQNVRQAITPHALVYGQKLIGGAITFVSSSSDNLFLHLVVTLAAHKVDEIGEVWLNDECIPPDHLDATGNVIAGRYEGFVRIRKMLGDPAQAADPYLFGEVAEWSEAHRMRGRAYLYVRLKFSQDVFQGNIPNIAAVVKGKRVLDPRDGNLKFTSNAALIARDYLADADYGFEAEQSIDNASAVAAANICDEIVSTQPESLTVESVSSGADWIEVDANRLPFALGDRVDLLTSGTLPGGLATATDYYVIPYQFRRNNGAWANNKPRMRLATSLANAEAGIFVDISSTGSGTHTVRKTGEPRFHGAALVDSSATLGSNLSELLSAFGGRAVYAGGFWRLLAAAYQTPTVTITENDLIGPIGVQTKISRSERFNKIKGVYTSHLNDWQSADFPPLTDDASALSDGQVIARDYDLPATDRPYTAQRIAKIELKKAVQELVVKVQCNLMALQLQAGDTCMLTNARLGWSGKPFEVTDFKFILGGNGDAPQLGVELMLRETAESIFDWSSSEEADIDEAPNTNLPNPFSVAVVSGLRFDSIPVATRDGDEVYNILVSWDVHPDAFVLQGGWFEVQYKATADADYQPSFRVDGELVNSTIAVGSSGVSYMVRVRAVNHLGARSAWQSLSGIITGSSGGIVSSADWGSVADSVTTSADWGAASDPAATSDDWGTI